MRYLQICRQPSSKIEKMSSTAADPSEGSIPHNPPPPLHQEHRQEAEQQQHQKEQQQPLLQPPALLVFDHRASKYKCCCGCIHVKIGVIIIGILSFISLTLGSAVLISERSFIVYFHLGIWLLWIPILICLSIGIFTNNQFFLLPYIFYSTIMGIAVVNFSFYLIYLLSIGSPKINGEIQKHSISIRFGYDHGVEVVIVGVVIEMILQVSFISWFIWVTIKCYRYFRDLKNYSGNAFIGNEP